MSLSIVGQQENSIIFIHISLMKNTIIHFLFESKIFFLKLTNLIHDLKSIHKKHIVVNSYMQMRWGTPIRRNWGDDFNFHLICWLTQIKYMDYRTSFFTKGKENFLCIGSILHIIGNEQSIVWGSGLMGSKAKIKDKKLKITAVRGPLTRLALEEQGVACPDVYGDPALLVSIMYQPPKKKKYKFGIIPHLYDRNSYSIKTFKRFHHDSIIIDIKNYKEWREVPRKICECEYIISSSLHGLIVSDAYDIPNVWVEFNGEVGGRGFKFKDYFSSVGRNVENPVICKESIDLESIMRALDDYKPCSINLERLVMSCPFIDDIRKNEVIMQVRSNLG